MNIPDKSMPSYIAHVPAVYGDEPMYYEWRILSKKKIQLLNMFGRLYTRVRPHPGTTGRLYKRLERRHNLQRRRFETFAVDPIMITRMRLMGINTIKHFLMVAGMHRFILDNNQIVFLYNYGDKGENIYLWRNDVERGFRRFVHVTDEVFPLLKITPYFND